MRTKLFSRKSRTLQLTPSGEMLLVTVTRCFRELHQAAEAINSGPERHVLKICGYTNFTMRWLIPRLKDFHGRYSDIDIQLTSSMETVDFDRSQFDAAIRSGTGDWPNWDCVELAPIEFIPVCSPQMAGELAAAGIGGLAKTRLLHSLARRNDWRIWLNTMGVEGIDPKSGIFFDNGSLAYEAAHEGIGVAIAQRVLVLDDLRAGRLAAPFPTAVPSGESYWFVSPQANRSRKLLVFRNWLAEASRDAFDSINLQPLA